MNEQIWYAAQHRVEQLRHEACQQHALSALSRPLRLHLATVLHHLADRLEGRRDASSHAHLRA